MGNRDKGMKTITKHKIAGLFMAGACLLYPNVEANGEELLIQQNSDDVIWQMDRGDIVGQSFTATLTGTIKEIGLECNGATVDIQILEGEGSRGRVLYQERGVVFPNSYRRHTMHKLKNEVPVQQGKQYTLVITNQDNWGMRGFFSSRKDDYSGGKRFAIKTSYKERFNLDLSFVIKGEGINTGTHIIGKANDITIDSDGTMYAVGSQKGRNGYALFKWAKNDTTWRKLQGDALRIAAIPGQAWVVNAKGEVFHEHFNSWKRVSAPVAKDIGAGGSDVWITAQDGKVYRNILGNWIHIKAVKASKIDVDDSGVPWIINDTGQLAYIKNDTPIYVNSSKVTDLAASRPGFVQVVDEQGNIFEYNVATKKWAQISDLKDAIGIGGGQGKIIRLTKELDIFRMR